MQLREAMLLLPTFRYKIHGLIEQMAIDYVIEYKCYPKQELTTEGILERIMGRARAEAVIKLFRENGDNRPVPEIGFELERTSANGESETKVVMIQTLLDRYQPTHICDDFAVNRGDDISRCWHILAIDFGWFGGTLQPCLCGWATLFDTAYHDATCVIRDFKCFNQG